MRANPVRELWGGGKAVLNGWCAIPSPFSAEIMASLGWDSVTVDMQHGVIDYQAAVGMFQAISTTAAAPLARVPWNDPAIVMKMLDAGAYGVICPLVNTAGEARRFAGACRYPPRGYRSSGPVRAALYGGADYFDHADDTVLAIAMVETAEALANLEAILAVDEVDAVYVGPSDLSLSLGGRPGLDQTEPRVLEAIEAVAAAARRRGKKAGIQTNDPGYARRMIALGYDLVTVMNDNRLMAAAGARIVAEMREDPALAPASPRRTEPLSSGDESYG